MSNTDLYLQSAQSIARFYHYLDTNDYDGLMGLISDDTVWVRQGKPRTGPQDIREALAERNPDRKTFHQVSNLRVTASDDGKTGTAHYSLAVYDNLHPQGVQLVAVLFVEDKYTLVDGAWRLAEKRSSKHL